MFDGRSRMTCRQRTWEWWRLTSSLSCSFEAILGARVEGHTARSSWFAHSVVKHSVVGLAVAAAAAAAAARASAALSARRILPRPT